MQSRTGILRSWRSRTAYGASILALCAFSYAVTAHGAPKQGPTDAAASVRTNTPIKHVIILIGENRGLDHTFGVYKPKGAGQTISNLLSKRIVKADGSPGPNYNLAQQFAVAAQPLWYFGAPDKAKTPYGPSGMPQPNTNGAPGTQGSLANVGKVVNGLSNQFPDAPVTSFSDFAAIGGETDIQPANQELTTTGATGLPNNVLDTRVPGAGGLPAGPFALLGPNIGDDDYTGDMTHRFYQAAQQQDCNIANATKHNPTGCLNDLFAFVMDTYDRTNATTQGNFSEGNEMGFYNAEQEQASILKALADRFTLSDNFHQSFLGGTAQNHVMFGTGDAIFWSDGNGNATTPPANLVANPNPAAGTVNKYTADKNFSNCSDVTQPGVKPIVDYLDKLPYPAEANCADGHYYMLDNTNPGFLPNGTLVPSPATQGSIPPSPVKTIGDSLSAKNISWAYFGGNYNNAVALANFAAAPGNSAILNSTAGPLTAAAEADPVHAMGALYCQICNPFQYASSIMTNNPSAHLKDTVDLIADIQNTTLPAVSIGKPDGVLDGHPSSSKIDLFEAYVENILDALDANPTLKASTVVFITWDEAGGYYDSGFIQPIDFFGDGPRIPLLVLSPYSTGGKVNHSYSDHVSLLKFIERNWALAPVTDRSRDNLPNPIAKPDDAYVPRNSPALDDLFDAFDFSHAVNQPYIE
jgi:phospholipase C